MRTSLSSSGGPNESEGIVRELLAAVAGTADIGPVKFGSGRFLQYTSYAEPCLNRRTLPGSAPVAAPFSSATWPLQTTQSMPLAKR